MIQPLADDFVTALYDEWQKGISIRKLATTNNIGRQKITAAFHRKYGKDSTSPTKQGLARVVRIEYGDSPEVVEVADRCRGIEGAFRTARTERYYSKYHDLPIEDFTETLSYEIAEERTTPLALPYFICMFSVVAGVLGRLWLELCQIERDKWNQLTPDTPVMGSISRL